MRADRLEVVSFGLVIGFVGYAIVFLGVGAGDVVQGRSFFYTFSLLGETLYYGLDDPAQVRVWPGAVFAYNGVHLMAFLAFGVVASWMASVAERRPLLWYGALVMYLFVFLHMFASVVFMTEPMRASLSMWQVALPSLVALVAMTWVLIMQHPQLRRELREWDDPDDDEEEIAASGEPLTHP
jgi:hypothetical protein